MNTTKTWTHEATDLVWHYTNGPALQNMLTNHELWASSTAFMNDAGESRLAVQYLKEERAKMGRKFPKILDSYLDNVGNWDEDGRSHASFYNSSNLRFLLSAAKSGDSLTLWRGYAGTGDVAYAVGLDRREMLNILATDHYDPKSVGKNTGKLRQWFDIDYSRSNAQKAAKDAVEEIILTYKGAENDARGDVIEKIDELTEKLRDEIKHEGFVHEEEVRIMAKVHHDLIRYRPGRFGMVPYIALTGPGGSLVHEHVTNQRRKLPIREIYISPGIYQSDAEQSLSLFLDSTGYGPDYDANLAGLVNEVEIRRSPIPFR